MKLFVLITSAFISAFAGDLAISFSPGEIQINLQNKPILVYAHGTNQFKPYVKSLRTLSGQNVLRDAPADHLHHHGLMYAVRVNEINFWEEVNDPGHQLSGEIVSHFASKTAAGLSQAGFTHLIHWVSPAIASSPNPAAVALLTETRAITVEIDEREGEVAVEWRGEFKVGATPVKLTGSFYNGLGLRLPQSFDLIAHHQNSEKLPYSIEQERDVTAARWSSVTGLIEGKPATAALFGTPSNPGDTRFYTMLKPFAYLSVTQNLENKPLDYAAHDRFAVSYLLTLYAGSRDGAFLNERLKKWRRACKD